MDKGVSMAELAARAGYHKSTVSRALRSDPTIPAATRDHILKIARSLGYRPHPYLSKVMTLTRSGKPQRFVGETLIWITESRARMKDWRETPFMAPYFNGARERAEELGRKLEMIAPDEFFTKYRGKRGVEEYANMLKARGIPGIIMPELQNRPLLENTWNDFSVVSINPADPYNYTVESAPFNLASFNRVTSDRYHNMLDLMHGLREIGYHRMGLLTGQWTDKWQSGRPRAAYWLLSQQFNTCIEPLYHSPEEQRHRSFLRDLKEWIEAYKIEVIIADHSHVINWLSEIGLSVPDDIGVVHQNIGEDVKDWSGIDINMKRISELAVDILVSAIQRNECGPSEHPALVYVRGRVAWGRTTQKRL